MANISAIKKVRHVVTVAEVSAGGGIKVLWDSPFYDTNYAISVTLELVGPSVFPEGNSFVEIGNIINVTASGFEATWFGVPISAGDVIIVHAMASHK